MEVINISERLKTVSDLIPQCNIFADIGTDHGYLAIHAIQRGLSKQVIACDIAKKPLQQAVTQINEYNLGDSITTRLGPGLSPIKKGEIDGAVIAGMGGSTMVCILEEDKEISKELGFLVLQPQNNSAKLRKWLMNNGFLIVAEELLEENNIIYQVIKAVPGVSENLNKLELSYGSLKNIKDKPLLKKYLSQEIKKYEKIINQMNKSKNHAIIKKKQGITKRIDLLKTYMSNF